MGKLSVAGKKIFVKLLVTLREPLLQPVLRTYEDWRTLFISNIELILKCPVIIAVMDSPKESVVLTIMARAAY